MLSHVIFSHINEFENLFFLIPSLKALLVFVVSPKKHCSIKPRMNLGFLRQLKSSDSKRFGHKKVRTFLFSDKHLSENKNVRNFSLLIY